MVFQDYTMLYCQIDSSFQLFKNSLAIIITGVTSFNELKNDLLIMLAIKIFTEMIELHVEICYLKIVWTHPLGPSSLLV